MARAGSKRQIAIEVMNANSDKPMAETVDMMAAAVGLTRNIARSYYIFFVKQGMATGVIEKSARVKKSVERQVAQVVAEAVADAPVMVAELPVAAKKPSKPKKEAKPAKSPEEIEKIKAANLERLKAVHKRVKQEVVAEEQVIEVDPFMAPEHLTMDEVKVLV